MEGFEIREAVIGDVDDICLINAIAFRDIPIIKATHHEADWDTILAWFTAINKRRMQDKRYHYILAVDNQTKKVVGCAGICLAGDPPTSTPAQTPVWPKGMNAELGNFLMGPLFSEQKNQGYTETKHCRRAGMFILPEYQKRGIATVLSMRCNDLADEMRAPTYVTAMPAAKKTLLKSGFELLQTVEVPLKEYGGPDIVVQAYVMYRPVPDS